MATINGTQDPKVSPKKKTPKKKAAAKKKTPKGKKAKAAQGTTFKSEPGKPEEHTTANVPIDFVPACKVEDGYLTANVNVSAGARIGLENYSDARCGASLTIPCAAVPEQIDKAFEWAKEWVETRVQGMIDEINEGNG